MMNIHWHERRLCGLTYWEALDSESEPVPGVPLVRESLRCPGAYFIDGFDSAHLPTLAEAKREALRKVGES